MSDPLTRREMLAESTWGLLRSLRDRVQEIAARVPDLPEGDPGTGDGPAGANGSRALPWVRPPGALEEEDFLRACTRCDDCIPACPHRSIRKLGDELGEEVAGTPAILPKESPCFLCADLPCIAACEPGALRPLAREEARMGVAVIDEGACYAVQGQPCDYCIERCPLGEAAIRADASGRPIIEDGCTGCGVCVFLCPPRAIELVAG